MSYFTRKSEYRSMTYVLFASVIFMVLCVVFTAFTAPAPHSQKTFSSPHMPAVSASTCQSNRFCRCLLERAETYEISDSAIGLGQDDRPLEIGQFDITDDMLTDAYFQGYLPDYLESMRAEVSPIMGRQRDQDLAVIRDLQLRTARAVAGKCMPTDRHMTVRFYHASGMSKLSIEQLLVQRFETVNTKAAPKNALALRR